MFWNLFKSEEKKVTPEERLKKELWDDSDVTWFLVKNKLILNEDYYSTQDLINIKKAATKKKEKSKENNHKELYKVLKIEYDYEPDIINNKE